ncbi:MAG: MATE family efflux transporter [Clostridia bacterium]|nr:MATE family efflux transporter [Clostridia bacterium]
MTKALDLDKKSLIKKIILFTVPIMLQGLLQSLYNSADLIVVGKFAGNTALAAVSATSSAYSVLVNLFICVAAGVDVVASLHYGMRDNRGVKQTIDTAILASPIIGIAVMVVGILITRPVLVLMNTPEGPVLEGAVTYMCILMIGVPFSMLFNFCSAVLRTSGETKSQFVYLAISGIANVALNLILVIIFHLGVIGVAVGTVVSQMLSAVLIMIKLLRSKGLFSFSFKGITFSWQKLKRILLIGIPAGIQGSVFSISNAFLQTGVNSFGEIAMAGSAATANIEGLLYVTVSSFQNAATTFTGRFMGEGKIKRIKHVFFTVIGLSAITGIVLGLTAFAFGRQLISIYVTGQEAIMYGYQRLVITFPVYFLAGLMGTLPGCVRGMGHSIPPTIISLIGACGLRILWIYTVFAAYPSMTVLYLIHPITWIVTTTSLIVCFAIFYKKEKRRRGLLST